MKTGIRTGSILTALLAGTVIAGAHPHQQNDGQMQRRSRQRPPAVQGQQRSPRGQQQFQQQRRRPMGAQQQLGRRGAQQFQQRRSAEPQRRYAQGRNQGFAGGQRQSNVYARANQQRGPQQQQFRGQQKRPQQQQFRGQQGPQQQQLRRQQRPQQQQQFRGQQGLQQQQLRRQQGPQQQQFRGQRGAQQQQQQGSQFQQKADVQQKNKRQALLQRFDSDQDGRLSDDERKAARTAIKEHRSKQGGNVPNNPKARKDAESVGQP